MCKLIWWPICFAGLVLQKSNPVKSRFNCLQSVVIWMFGKHCCHWPTVLLVLWRHLWAHVKSRDFLSQHNSLFSHSVLSLAANESTDRLCLNAFEVNCRLFWFQLISLLSSFGINSMVSIVTNWMTTQLTINWFQSQNGLKCGLKWLSIQCPLRGPLRRRQDSRSDVLSADQRQA